MKKLELKNIKGSYDYESKDQIIRNYISDTLRKVFEKYGYKPLSTSILCYYDLLALKYDDDNDILNEIYKVTDQAKRNLALRYDLTVPFAKYIAVNKNINFPYKRYEIGKVFRDGPVKQGRVREFIQCDVDSVGIEGQLIEAELMNVFVEGYSKLGIDIVIKYNNRKIMSGIIEICKITKEKINQTITIIDKFEKLTKEEMRLEFVKIGLEEEQINNLIKYLNMNFDEIKEKCEGTQNLELQEGIKEINELNKYIKNLNLNKYVQFTATLARGQEYYTGTVFEVYQANGEIKSSIGGGGRYDKMIGNFIGDDKKYPAVGISFGLDVIFDILKAKGNLKNTNIDVYIIPMENKVQALKIATDLRKQDINVDIEMNNKKLKKSLNYANIEEIPSVIIIGDDELKEDKVIIKNMKTGSQIKVKIEEIAKNLKNIDKSLNYKILNPGGNKTAIVIGNKYSNEDKKKINDKILKENPDVEQVGFISKKENKLEMAGGEFCMNATRCAIWEYLKGNLGEIELNVSGCKEKISGGITKEKEVYVNMQINKKMSDIIEKNSKLNFVKLDGILLAIIDEENSKEYIEELKKDEEKAKSKLKEIMQTFETYEKALGIILLEKEKSKTKINPIIWVKTIDTLYYETACGSGSLATAIYKNYIEGIENLEIMQPSGYSININLNKKQEYIENAIITGKVIEEE